MPHNEKLFQEMHLFTMRFFDTMNTLEPNPEMMEMMKSDKGLRLIKTITDFYSEILDDEEIEWIINENLNGTGKQIIDKLMLNMHKFRSVLVPRIQEFEI